MLKITVPATEFFDESASTFVSTEETVLELEHSLVSLSKWESNWEVPFFDTKQKTTQQTLDYVKCMTLNEVVDDRVYAFLSSENISKITEYINAKQTATWFREEKQKPGPREIVTSELIYYWMISLSIPFECQHWHLNRLMTLIRVCNKKNAPEKKMSRAEIAARNRALNAERKAKLGTRG